MKNSGNVAVQVTLLYLFWFASCALSILNFIVTLSALRSVAVVAGAD